MKRSHLILFAWLALAGMLLLGVDLAQSADLAIAQAVNKSGRQRMLAQRIVKAYLQAGQGITPEASRRQLHDAVHLFETQLVELRKVTLDEGSKSSMARLERSWRPFKTIALGTLDRGGAERLLALDEELVAAAHELTLVLQNLSGSLAERLVDISGRQRMLSQRLAKLYLMRAWGMESPYSAREIGSARAEFDGALATLRSARENTGEIKRELDAVALQWEWFQNALGLDGAASYGLIVVNAAEAILGSMEVVTGLYEKLAAGQ